MPPGLGLGLGLHLGSAQGGVGGEWTPAALPGINKWYDGNDISTITMNESNLVSKWTDKIYGEDATAYKQSNAAYSPTYDANKKALIFDGSQVLSRVHGLTQGNINVTFIYIIKRQGSYVSGAYLMGHSGTTTIRIVQPSSGSLYLRSSAILTLFSLADAVMADKYRLISFNYNSESNSSIVAYKCGGTVEDPGDESVTGAAGTSTFLTANPIFLMAQNATAASGIKAELKGMISVLGTVSDEDMAKLYSFVKEYYGVDTL